MLEEKRIRKLLLSTRTAQKLDKIKIPERNLFKINEIHRQLEVMQEAIENFVPRYALNDWSADYWQNQKASDELEKIFGYYFKQLNLPVEISKNKYYRLIEL